MVDYFELGFKLAQNEIALSALPVKGRLPEWLSGTLIRNGPGTFQVGSNLFKHWFDGYAMLHQFKFANGTISYKNKFLNTRAYKEAMNAGRMTFPEFATDPSWSFIDRVKVILSPRTTDDAKVSIAKFDGHFLALAETPIQVEFDPDSLETRGNFLWEAKPVGQMTTVHPTFDRERGEAYNLVVRYHAISHYHFYRMKEFGKPKLISSIPVSQPAYLHSFGMSKNYLILAEFPMVVYPIRLLLWLSPFIENFRWKPGHGTKFLIIHRGTGKVIATFEQEAFFAFHHVNAFERGDELVVDLVAYQNADILQAYYLKNLANPTFELPFGNLRRYVFPLKRGSPKFEVISHTCMELSHFDIGRFNMQDNYRYVYAVSIRPEKRSGFYNQIVKVDINSRQEWRWFQEDCYPGEPIFVARPGSTAEDDGIILSVVLDANIGNAFLLVLNARDFTEIARAEVPHPILFGYHGIYSE